MNRTRIIHDIFFSFANENAAEAEKIIRKLVTAGLKVFSPAMHEVGEPVGAIWDELTTSLAFVVFLSDPQQQPTPNMLVELGGAMAWKKPIYALYSTRDAIRYVFLTDTVRLYRTDEIDKMVEQVKEMRAPISRAERQILAEVYAKHGVPTDQLLRQQKLSMQFLAAYHRAIGRRVPDEAVLREVLTLRKTGKLPRLQKQAGNKSRVSQKRR